MVSFFFKGIDRLVDIVLALALGVMLVVVAAQVWYRFVCNDPLAWSEELARYLFVWISFLGAAVGVRMKVHLGIDLLEKALSPLMYKLMAVAVNLAIQIFLLVVIFWGVKILGIVKFQTSASMGISMAYPYLAVPVGAGFMLLNSLRVTWEMLRSRQPEEVHP